MKRTEVATIILIAAVSVFLTFLLVQWLTDTVLKDQIRREVTVPVSQEVSSEIVQPSKRIFNRDAINPTVEVCVEVVGGAAEGQAECRMSPVETQSQSEDASKDAAATDTTNNTN